MYTYSTGTMTETAAVAATTTGTGLLQVVAAHRSVGYLFLEVLVKLSPMNNRTTPPLPRMTQTGQPLLPLLIMTTTMPRPQLLSQRSQN